MRQLRIGITGGIGSGKSTVCRVLEIMGYPVYYSDNEAKRLMHEDPSLIAAIKTEFGEAAYQHGELDRAFIAGIIFNRPEKKNSLNALVHPKVRADFDGWAEKQESALVFQESALLFETGGYKLFDHTILVTAPEHIRIKRIQSRDNLSEAAIKARMANQLKDEEKLQLAGFVIENDGEKLVLPQVLTVLKRLT